MKFFFSIVFVLLTSQLPAQISDFSHVDFKKADSIALSYSSNAIDNLPKLTYNLTSGLETDVERFRAIYRWICANIKNDYGLYIQNKHKRNRFKDDSIAYHKWHTMFKQKVFKKLLKKKRTICTGYAYLLKTMCDFANIECELINGFGRVSTTDIENLTLPNHSWNAVKLNNKWYLCDPTWASGIPDPDSNHFMFSYNDGFFLTNPELFAVNHFPVESRWWLLKNEIPTFEDFKNSPVIYGNAYKKLSSSLIPKEMHHEVKPREKIIFQLQLKTTEKETDVHFVIDNGSSQSKIKPNSITITETSLTLEHQFKKTGFYDIHLYIGEDLISTYTVNVEK